MTNFFVTGRTYDIYIYTDSVIIVSTKARPNYTRETQSINGASLRVLDSSIERIRINIDTMV